MNRRLVALAIVVPLALLVAAQLIAPGIAERRLEQRLERVGDVEAVDIDALPAVKLLWDRADSVTVRMHEYSSGPGELADLLEQAAATDRLDAGARRMHASLLTFSDARLVKHGDRLAGAATITAGDLRAALPPPLDLRPEASPEGTLTLRGGVDFLGFRASAGALVRAEQGSLVVSPTDVPFGGLLRLKIFDDSRLRIESVGAEPHGDGGFTLFATAHLP